MSARKITTRPVSREQYKAYRKKAIQFLGVMRMCLQDEEWDAVILNGVHACICINDALTVFHSGQRSSSKEHRDAAILLTQSLSQKEGTRRNASRLAEIIDQKNLVSYEPKRFSGKEGYSFAQKVERFFEWAERMLPKG